MLNAVKGRYRNGRVELEETPSVPGDVEVLVVFLDPQPFSRTQLPLVRLGGTLSEIVELPEGDDADPVAEALAKLRDERGTAFDAKWQAGESER